MYQLIIRILHLAVAVVVIHRLRLVVLEPLDKDMLEEAQYVEVVLEGIETVVVEAVVLLL